MHRRNHARLRRYAAILLKLCSCCLQLCELRYDKKQFQPKLTTFTTRTLCSSGTTVKFTLCTAGHTSQLAFIPVTYAFSSFFLAPSPSRYPIVDRKTAILVQVKTVWSRTTRAMVVLAFVLRLTFFARNWYHRVAAGPKTTVYLKLELLFAVDNTG